MGQIRGSGHQKELMCNGTGSVTLVFCLHALYGAREQIDHTEMEF